MLRLPVFAAVLGMLATPAFAGDEAPSPRLIVAIAVDQFSAGLFDQYRDHFRYGFRRLLDSGQVFPNGYQSHAATETCPGHSTLLTGRHPSVTGIVANNWIDARGRKVYCVEDRSVSVPGRPNKPRGPANLRVSTLGEWLGAADSDSRTVVVSGKDRAAITLAGHTPTAVFWWDDERGFNSFVPPGATAAARLAPVAAFNAAIDQAWAENLPKWESADPDCARLDGPHRYFDDYVIDHRVPPPMRRDATKPLRTDKAFRTWVNASPILDRLTLDLAVELIDRFRLGRRQSIDLLAVSLSATDYVGHTYGTQGPEMCDQLAQLDRMLGDFLAGLDGLKIPYALVLTADHGAVDAAERVTERGVAVQRITLDLPAVLNPVLRKQFGLDFDPLRGDEEALYDSQSLYVDHVRSDPALARQLTRATLTLLHDRSDPAWPWHGLIIDAFARDNLLELGVSAETPANELSLAQRYARSIDAERSPDILVAFTPGASLGRGKPPANYIAGHGSPWDYDRRVPILFLHTGGLPFEQSLPIETVDIAPTLAALVGIQTRPAVKTADDSDPRPVVDGRCRDLDPGAGTTCR